MTELAIPESDHVEVELAGRGIVMVPQEMIAKFPALNPELDLAELLEGALGQGGELRLSDLTRIKVPSAELKRLMVPDENGEPTPVAELTGIPVAQTSRRSFWVEKTVSGKAPDCKSNDTIHGIGLYGRGSEGNPSGLCEKCPMAARGSADTGTEASACKEQKLLFLLTDRELLPLMVVIPSGSLKSARTFGVGLATRGILGPPRPEMGINPRTGKPKRASQWLAIEVGIGLEQKTNPAGQDYNSMTFKQVRKLSPGEMEVISVYGLFIDEMIAKQADQLDQVAADVAGGGAGVSAEERYDGEGELLDDEALVDGVTVPGTGSRR